MSTQSSSPQLDGIAIIGMQGRFPGARTVEQFWSNLVDGVESISTLTDEQLIASGVPESSWRAANYVRAKGVLDAVEQFDAAFFNVLPKDAAVMDPQHRLFLECAWEALERAGYDPAAYAGHIGVFAGAYLDTYLLANLCSRPGALAELVQSIQVGTLQTELGNDKDYLATRVSYKLNLRGPSMTIQSACSTSLVAIAQACQSLVTYQCDMALAGGVTVTVPQARGYHYQPDGMLSPDGHCRPFDAQAQGTVFSNGLGVVVLKRLADAIADGDHVVAVVRGWALNNDGASKLSYTAPSVDGQADVVAMAHAMAGVEARSISYVEAHGTATPLGDPIEIAALTKAFRLTTDDTQFCAIGSLKSNLGHLDVASGVAAVMKTALSLRHRMLPPTLHYTKANPKIDFQHSPFRVNDTLSPWPETATPRRAGVSSFGVGGTNAHVILEEAPGLAPSRSTRDAQVLLLSARSATALDAATAALAAHLESDDATPLADIAYTLQVGRRAFPHRRAIACASRDQAVEALRAADAASAIAERNRRVVFMIPGQGAQHPGMGRALYDAEATFRDAVDRCASLLTPTLGLDLRTLLYPADVNDAEAARQIRQTSLAQPSLFVTSYALAQLWMSWGVTPAALVGHSVGELVAACLAGVIELADALELLAARGQLMQAVEPGAMLSVRLPADAAMAIAGDALDLAASNSPQSCVIAGPHQAVADLEAVLASRGIGCSRLHTSHAFHSRMMDEVVAPFEAVVRRMTLSAPRIPIASSVTGQWLTDDEARHASYWSHHLRRPVRFSEAVARLGTDGVLLEVGPGQTLSMLARQTLGANASVVSSLPHAETGHDAAHAAQAAAGRLWMHGVDVQWASTHAEPRRRVPLPTYPFERQRHWIDADPALAGAPRAALPAVAPPPAAVSAAVPAASDRDSDVHVKLTKLLSDLSGIEAANLTTGTPFLDLGFDSLLLTQVSAACQRQFGVAVTMRQLLADLPTIGRLSVFLAERMVATAATPEAPALAPRPAVAPASGPAPAISGFKPPDRAPSVLTGEQQQHLDALIERYTARTQTSKQLTAKYRPVHADPRTVAGFNRAWKEMVYPIVVNRSSGARLWDVDGNEYIDMLNGFGPNFLGHSPRVVVEALKAQLDCGIEVGPQTPLAGEVAALIAEMTGMDRVSFVNTGSEAVQAAIRLARTVTGRDRVVVFTKDYHGNFDEVLVRRQVIDGEPRAMPIAPGIPPRAVSDMVVLEYGTDEALEYIRHNGHTLAAVLIEPIQSRRPEFQPRAFIHEVRRLTEQSGTVMVMDEVITGFRLGPGGAQEFYGVRADLATYGKVVGGGMPIGVVAGRADLMDTFDGGQWNYGDDSFPEKGVTFFAGTFVRHPLAMAAAKASLDFLKAQPREAWDAVHRRTTRLAEAVNALLVDHGAPIELAHFGSQMFVRVRDDAKLANLVFFHLRARGVFLAEGFPSYMTLAHTDRDIDTVIDAWRDSLAAMRQAGFFGPRPPRHEPAVVTVPLTAAQHEIWLAVQMNPAASIAFNEATTIRFHGELDVEALRRSCRDVAARHDALGATIDGSGDQLRFAGPLVLDVPLVDVSAEAAPEQALDARIAAEASSPFDLERGPLVRATLVKLSAAEHVLLLTAHHIVCDGWSFNVLVAEVSRTYSARRRGLTAALPAAPSFAEFVRVAHRQIGSAEDAEVERYWRQRFEAAPPALELPADFPRPPVREGRGTTTRRTVAKPLADAIRAMSRQHGCTLFAALFGAYRILLHRLSGQSDLCVGVPVAAQTEPRLNHLVGYAINFLPFRSTLAAETPFADYIRSVRDEVAEGLAHQPFTYGRLLRSLALPRVPGRLPLVEVEFNLERMDRYDEFEGVTTTFEAVSKRAVNFDLFLNIVETDDGLILECDHATDLFTVATVERWLESYERLLRSAVDAPRDPVGRLDLLTDMDRRGLALGLAAGVTQFPHAAIHQLIEAQCDRTPDAPAIDDGTRVYSYRAVDQMANRLAHQLRAAGTQPGDLVAVALDTGVDLIATVLGVLKCGAAYMPIDPAHPRSRIEAMLRNANPRVVVNAGWLEGADADAEAQNARQRVAVAVAPRDRAYVLHTSGTTGVPKGVEIEHRSVVNLLCHFRQALGLSAADRWLAITTPTFDIAALEWFLPLMSGATVVCAPREVARDGDRLSALLQMSNITVMQATPSTWRMLVDAGWRGDDHLQMLCGGEPLPRELAARLVSRGRRLLNVYGPTETTIWSSMDEVRAEAPISLGHPIANTQLFVLDAALIPVPLGVAGQLYIGGAGLARGYLNDQELTRQRFVTAPFDRSRRLYATGDLVRRTVDGRLEFLGRTDDQVKVRGHRVELAEVEAALADHPGVQAAAAATEAVDGRHRIVAALVPRGAELTVADVHAFLETRLPSHMWPSRIGFVDSLPLTSSAKVDRRRVRDVVTAAERGRQSIAGRNQTERVLARIWASALRVESVSVMDDVFELGADSLNVFQVTAAARKEGLAISANDILSTRTIARLAAMLTAESSDDDRRPAPVKLVRLADGPQTPLFLVHGISGELVSYQPLADALSAKRRVFGFGASLGSLDGHDSVESLAEAYVRSMREVCPEGPYHVGGFCGGGLIAFEMARQLRAQKAPVGVVALLDASVDDSAAPFVLEDVLESLINLPRWIADDARVSGWRHFVGRVASRSRQLGRLVLAGDGPQTAEALRDELGVWNLSSSELEIVMRLHGLIEAYRPASYDGRALLVRPRANPLLSGGSVPGMGWASRVTGLDEVVVTGSHSTMLSRAFAGELAATLEVWLSRADGERTTGVEPRALAMA